MTRLLLLFAVILTACGPTSPSTAFIESHPEAGAPLTIADAAPSSAPALCPHAAWELGDSITSGKGGVNQAGYRPELATWFTDCSTLFLGTTDGPLGRHDGHPGYDLQAIRNVVARNYATHQHVGSAELVILMAGANNMDTVTPYDPEATPAIYAALLEDLSVFPETRIAVSTVTPHQSDVAEARILEFNAALPAIWDRYDLSHPERPLLRADQHAAVGGEWSSEFFADAVHPNPAGYSRIAKEWIRTLGAQP